MPAVNVVPKPKGLSWEEAAALPLVTLTAWHMLVTRARVEPGEDVLVHAAGSGVGSIGIQVAKLRGARVIATAGSAEKLEKARALGADEVVDYTNADWPKEVRRLTDKRGVDVVFEHTGAETWPGSILSLKRDGRLVTCGATSGYDARTDIRQVFFRHLSLLGSMMGSKAELLDAMQFVERGADSRRHRPHAPSGGGAARARVDGRPRAVRQARAGALKLGGAAARDSGRDERVLCPLARPYAVRAGS